MLHASQLITMEKVEIDPTATTEESKPAEDGERPVTLPAHYDFRTSYFAKPDR